MVSTEKMVRAFKALSNFKVDIVCEIKPDQKLSGFTCAVTLFVGTRPARVSVNYSFNFCSGFYRYLCSIYLIHNHAVFYYFV